MKKTMLMTLAATAAATAMSANLVWVGGAEGNWNDAENWDPQQIPTQNDAVFFDSAESITVNLGAEQAHGTLSVSNTPCLFFKGLESGSVMDARNDSKNIAAPVVFDENVRLNFTAGKVWRPASTLKLLGGLSGTSSSLEGSGVWTVCGPVDMAGVKCSATIDWNPSSMTDATYLSLGACDLQFNHAPATMGNLVRFENKTMSLSGVAPLTFKSSDAARPSAGINQYANPNIYLKRTMPTVFED